VKELSERAFDQAPARDANVAISRVREEVAARFGPSKSIEIVISPDEQPAALRQRLMSTLPAVLEAFGASLSASEGPVFLSVFSGEHLLFMTPIALMDGLRAVAGPVAGPVALLP
jgi:hypothetical protein